MRKHTIILQTICLLFLLWVCMACRENDKSINHSTNVAAGSKKNSMPQIPSMITNRSEQLNYLAEHYWDGFNFCNTVNADDPVVENNFTEYLHILTQVPPGISKSAMRGLMRKSGQEIKVFIRFCLLSEKYLYDPNSTLRNEHLYIEVLKSILSNKKLPREYKIRPLHQYKLACRNIPGSKAANIKFKIADGRKGLLYKIKATYLLIYFNSPDCGDCKRVCALLNGSTVIGSCIDSGKLKILSVYPDEDLTVWKKENSSIPSSWINAYNPEAEVKKNETYDLKAIPTLYLLDENKHVILKDAMFEEVERFLAANAGGKIR